MINGTWSYGGSLLTDYLKNTWASGTNEITYIVCGETRIGRPPKTSSTIQTYNISTNEFGTLTALGFNNELVESSGGIINGKLYIIGGIDYNYGLNTNIFAIDLETGSVETRNSTFSARFLNRGAVYGKYIYIYGGGTTSGDILNTFSRYDTIEDEMESMGTMPGEIDIMSPTVYDSDYAYILSGGMFYKYNFANNTWASSSQCEKVLLMPSMELYNGTIFVWGVESNPPTDFYGFAYDISEDVWSVSDYPTIGCYSNPSYLYNGTAVVFTNKIQIYSIFGGEPESENYSAKYSLILGE